MDIVNEKWPEIIEHLRVEHELSNVSFTTWIQPLKVYEIIDNTVFILVNMNASVEYIEKKYLLPLKVCISEVTGIDYEVVFVSESARFGVCPQMQAIRRRHGLQARKRDLIPSTLLIHSLWGATITLHMRHLLLWRNLQAKCIIPYFYTEM